MTIEILKNDFFICKLNDISDIDFKYNFVFAAKTDNEISLVCEVPPDNCKNVDANWRAFRIAGTLDFSLKGILYKISKILYENNIGIFVVSTYDTDYILVKNTDLKKAEKSLLDNGYKFNWI